MEILKATILDIPQLLELEKENFKHPYNAENLKYEIEENPVSHFHLLKDGEEIIAFIDFWITFDSATICQICTKASRKKQGFAEFLLNDALKMMKDELVEFLTLEVRKSNIPAISFYKKHGFNEVTIKPQYYDDGEDAIYMVKGLI